ncbi:MAG: 3-phosphoserine/phosphohydroxythreonine transaminase [Sediminibacterium sp.]|nr:3-phosphoserine/phosphohydroxythreonine transaminase [Sediminibacterium sp.]
MKPINFNSGPAALPQQVIENGRIALENFEQTGLSILEIGHRTTKFKQIVDDAIQSVKRLMSLDNDFEVMFIAGGATVQFMQIPYNFLHHSETAGYIVNGIWGEKAVVEAKQWGQVNIVSNTAVYNHQTIETGFIIPPNLRYLHLTSNNTVEGTQWKKFPTTELPLIADMSSDIFSRNLDFKKFSLIYAGAQKNLGAAGVTLVVIRKDFIKTLKNNLSPILDYNQHIKAGSILNTPPVFAVFILAETLKWIESQGGLFLLEQANFAKAIYLYNLLDQYHDFYDCKVKKEHRSSMNICFYLKNEKLYEKFFHNCAERKFIGIKGYRTVGGVRVSMYNAISLAQVQTFGEFLIDFAKENG